MKPKVSDEAEMPNTRARLRIEFSKRLKELLLKAGMTQSELADKAELGRDSMSNYINAKSLPTPDTRIRLAKVLGIPPHELMPALSSAQSAFPPLAFERHGDQVWLRINQLVPVELGMTILQLMTGQGTMHEIVRAEMAKVQQQLVPYTSAARKK